MIKQLSILIMVLCGVMVMNDVQAKPVKIAMCQIVCLDGARSGNFVRIENALKVAKEKGADIACFPETSIYGWVNSDAHQRAFPIPGEDSERLCGLAKEYDIYICIGLAEKEGDKLYDSLILIDHTGKILLKHRKNNILSHLMTPPYTPGEEVQAVDTPYGRIGLLICADSFLQENLEAMRDLKPDLVLVPYGWAAKEEAWTEHRQKLAETVSRAAKTIGAPVVGTDLVGAITKGPWTGYTYGGQSVAADSKGIILAKGRDRDSDVVLVELGLNP